MQTSFQITVEEDARGFTITIDQALPDVKLRRSVMVFSQMLEESDKMFPEAVCRRVQQALCRHLNTSPTLE